LKAVTIRPAEILGVAKDLGSLEVDKRANLVITQGPLLQVTSDVKALFINGKPTTTESRHTRLHDKYRGRLVEVRAGRSPLGLVRSPAVDPAAAAKPGNGVEAGAGDGH